jgi:hypothetical protein
VVLHVKFAHNALGPLVQQIHKLRLPSRQKSLVIHNGHRFGTAIFKLILALFLKTLALKYPQSFIFERSHEVIAKKLSRQTLALGLYSPSHLQRFLDLVKMKRNYLIWVANEIENVTSVESQQRRYLRLPMVATRVLLDNFLIE